MPSGPSTKMRFLPPRRPFRTVSSTSPAPSTALLAKKVDSKYITPRVRRERQRLPSNGSIESAPDQLHRRIRFLPAGALPIEL